MIWSQNVIPCCIRWLIELQSNFNLYVSLACHHCHRDPMRLWEVVCVRTDKANFEPSPTGLNFSAKVNHYIQCINIIFIWINSIFCIFVRRFSRWPQNRLICLGRLWNLAINVGRCQNTVLLFQHLECFTCKSFIFLQYFKGLTIIIRQSLTELWIF